MSPRTRLVAAALLFSSGGTVIKLVGFGAWQVVTVRAAVSFIAMLVLIPEARRGWGWSSTLVGVAYAATTTLFVLSNTLTTAAGAVFIQNTSPLFVLALAPWVVHERPTRRDLEYMGVLVGGMVMLFLGGERRFATAPQPFLGNILAACCAVAWAVTLLGYRWLAIRGRPVAAAAAAGSLFAALGTLPLAWPLAAGAPRDWIALGYLGVFQLALAYRFMARALPHLQALEASLILLMEPVLASVWAWLVLGESLSPVGLMGAAIILAATLWHDARSRSRAASVPEGEGV